VTLVARQRIAAAQLALLSLTSQPFSICAKFDCVLLRQLLPLLLLVG
jgi:hypothetical protein